MKELLDNIDACLRTRELGAKALLETLKVVKDKISSEKEVKEIWQRQLSSNPSVYEKGWYEPPPDGFAVLACDDLNPKRLDFSSIREEKFWPKNDIFLSIDNTSFFYCSPIDKTRGIIGDFAVTLYGGDDQKTIEHIKKSLAVTKKIADYAKIGMSISEVNQFGLSLFDKFKLKNLDCSITDSMNINIGHTVPWTYEVMNREERSILNGGNWNELKDMISSKRKFVNGSQELKIQENMIFTVEPKLKSAFDPSIPAATFHMLVVFKGSDKTIVSNFGEIFKEWDMNYLEDI